MFRRKLVPPTRFFPRTFFVSLLDLWQHMVNTISIESGCDPLEAVQAHQVIVIRVNMLRTYIVFFACPTLRFEVESVNTKMEHNYTEKPLQEGVQAARSDCSTTLFLETQIALVCRHPRLERRKKRTQVRFHIEWVENDVGASFSYAPSDFQTRVFADARQTSHIG